jgi:hypothetical protein
MTTLRITFTWEDDGEDQAYDDLMQALMELGAMDIEEEVAPEPKPPPRTARKKKS